MDRALFGATIPGQSGSGSDGNEEVLRILQRSCITGTPPSDCLVSYLDTCLGGGAYLFAEAQSMYFTAPADGET